MLQYLVLVAFDWATRCFGEEQMKDPKTRALRLVEEAVELAQAVGVHCAEVGQCVDDVYARPKGAPLQAMGGVIMTAMLMSKVLQADPISMFAAELRRVLAKEPLPPWYRHPPVRSGGADNTVEIDKTIAGLLNSGDDPGDWQP